MYPTVLEYFSELAYSTDMTLDRLSNNDVLTDSIEGTTQVFRNNDAGVFKVSLSK